MKDVLSDPHVWAPHATAQVSSDMILPAAARPSGLQPILGGMRVMSKNYQRNPGSIKFGILPINEAIEAFQTD